MTATERAAANAAVPTSKLETALVDKLRTEVSNKLYAAFGELDNRLNEIATKGDNWRYISTLDRTSIPRELDKIREILIAGITKNRADAYIKAFIAQVESLHP